MLHITRLASTAKQEWTSKYQGKNTLKERKREEGGKKRQTRKPTGNVCAQCSLRRPVISQQFRHSSLMAPSQHPVSPSSLSLISRQRFTMLLHFDWI